MAEAVRQTLADLNTDVIEFKGDITDIPSTMAPMDAFQVIVEKGYLSAPVYQDNDQEKEYIGFLDTRTLVAWIVFAYDERNTTPSLEDIVTHGVKMTERAIDNVTITYLARFHPFRAVSAADSMLDICDRLSSRNHRVPIVDEEGNLFKIITQSTVIKFLHEHRDDFAEYFATSIADIEIGSAPVITVPSTSETIEVFQTMERYNLSGIGIVDEEGKLVGTTSGQDLKLFLRYRQDAALSLPIMPFLNQIRQESLRAIVPVLVCGENATLGEIIGRLAATRMHRIFVVDENDHPVKVISLSDILQTIVE